MVYLILKVTIPDLNFVKTLKVNNKERIYRIKEDIIKKCGKNENLLNYGFLLKDDHQSSIFLSESKILEDYNIDEKSKLEFVMRKRLNIEYTDTSSNTLSSKHQKKFIEEIQKKLYDKLAERLSKNFDPNFCTETGETPLTIAIQNNDIEVFNLLIKNGAYVNFRMNSKYYWMTPLHYAITIRNREMLTLLMKEGACVDETDTRGYSSLYLAVLNDENEYIKLLALSSSNFKLVDKDGNGLLHIAIKNNNIHALSLLIDCGAEMNIINNDGNSALHLSVIANNKEMVKKLITRGCNREIVNNDGKTAKGIAGLKGYSEVFEMLTNFNITMIEPPPPPFENKDKIIADLLKPNDTSKLSSVKVLLKKGTLVPETFENINAQTSVLPSQQVSHTTKKKRKEPPPPPLPLFDLKNLNIDELNNNTFNPNTQISIMNENEENIEIGSASSINEKSSESINECKDNNKELNKFDIQDESNENVIEDNEKENHNETKIDINNSDKKDYNNKSIINDSQDKDTTEINKNNNTLSMNDIMLNKKNFEMMVNILYDMLRIINVEEKKVRTMENYQSHIENKLSQQKYEYSNYKLLKTVDEENNNNNAI